MIEIPELAAGTIIEFPNPAKPPLASFERAVMGLQLAYLTFQDSVDLSTLQPGKEPLYEALRPFAGEKGIANVRLAVASEPIVESLHDTRAKTTKTFRPFLSPNPQIDTWKEERRAEANMLGISFHLLGQISTRAEIQTIYTRAWYIPRRDDIIAAMRFNRAIARPEKMPADELPAAFQHAAPDAPESKPRIFKFSDWEQGILGAAEDIKRDLQHKH
ncbi:MAG TPA: hypothetical protein VLG16_00450 [Candidatus Saccharimonadales bacterium]|nr:hypothetical protein [Candidatus Saccharimonadales bacterium]